MPAVHIHIDTDPGQDIDDLLALLFALRRRDLAVAGITTVTMPAARRARLVKRLLRHLGRDEVPVAAGMELPLRHVGDEELAAQRDEARTMNHACFAEPEDPRDDPGGADAVELIIANAERHAGALVMACIAPLTNLACALRRRPSIAGRIAQVLLMGGETALNRPEHNIAWDPVAADIVLRSGIPVAMGTWDVTRRCVLTAEDCRAFAASPRAECRALAAAIARWHPAQAWKPGPVLYDLFPLVQAVDPAFYTLAEQRVTVVTAEGPARGMTLPGQGAPVRVTTGLDAEALRRCYLDTVLA